VRDEVLVPIGVAAREIAISRERLRQLADAGRVAVVKDSTGRRFLEMRELDRLILERRKTSRHITAK
jgi:hypothetical protein